MNTVACLARLIAFDTTSRLSNLALIDDTATYFESLGLQPWLAYNAERSKLICLSPSRRPTAAVKAD